MSIDNETEDYINVLRKSKLDQTSSNTKTSIVQARDRGTQTAKDMDRIMSEVKYTDEYAKAQEEKERSRDLTESVKINNANWVSSIRNQSDNFVGGDYNVASRGKFNEFGTMLVEIDSDETAAYTDPAYGLTEELYGSKGSGKGGIVEQSYFNLALPKNSTSTSRSAGATTKAMKQKVIDLIINTGYQAGMTDVEVATTLAIAAHESGFNPEASARESSASGVGQFVNKTGADYGLTDSNRWDLDMQVQALVDHTKDNFIIVKNRGLSQDYVYALHHDGQTVVSKQGYSKTSAPGLKTSRKKVAPLINKYLTFVRSR